MHKLSPKIFSWATILESQAEQQIRNTASLPFIVDHIAVMPDAHYGKGSTIGTVIPTSDSVIPSAVGVDIGCGIIFAETDLRLEDLKDLSRLRGAIERNIPRGEKRNPDHQENKSLTNSAAQSLKVLEETLPGTLDPDAMSKRWQAQLGTLGGGNHFIELDLNEEGHICIQIHSGSRGVGAAIANHHTKKAMGLMERWYIQLPDKELAYLPEGSGEFTAYIDAQNWALAYAQFSRLEMMDRTIDALHHEIGAFTVLDQFDAHHNYVAKEHHIGRNIWVTRKGAVRAREGERTIIPGSMGSPSYLVTGKGNIPSFMSAPHGAGRAMSRRKAKEQFTLDQLQAAMVGIESNIGEAFIDEGPFAYKPIDIVMEDSRDLVNIESELAPVLNIKGN